MKENLEDITKVSLHPSKPASVYQSVKKKKYSAIVLEQIQDAIIRQGLKPGDILPSEAEMCRELNISKTSVREAIKMLEATGIVETRHGKGTFIRCEIADSIINPLLFHLALFEKSAVPLMELRKVFEIGVSMIALKKMSPEEIELLQESVRKLERNIANGSQCAVDDVDFHLIILRSTHNPYIISIGRTIYEMLVASFEKTLAEIPEKALFSHQKICQAFVQKDKTALLKYINHSIEEWEETIGKT